jgi:acyl phosphate:glycerol-3-phosphate acyltransferase
MSDSIGWAQFLPQFTAALAFGYVLGAIPFGIVITRLCGIDDLRSIGSGNIGATNVLRTGRKQLAAATLAGDALKGTAAVLIAGAWGPHAALIAGLGAFLGHLYPVWLGFRGGKGVATYLGILAGLAWPAALIFAFFWLITAYLIRYSSLAALVACTVTPFVLALLGEAQIAWLFATLTVLIYLTHRTNIARLLRGEEGRIGAGSAENDSR